MPTLEDTALEELFASLDEYIPCSYNDCEQEAVNLLKCPCGGGAETICARHTEHIRRQQETVPCEPIVFNGTCGHHPAIGECTIVAIG